MTVMIGISAFGSACFQITSRWLMPLDFAVETKSARMTSSILARVCRAMPAREPRELASTGRIKYSGPPIPLEGSSPSCLENSRTSISASQKPGIELHSSVMNSQTRSVS